MTGLFTFGFALASVAALMLAIAMIRAFGKRHGWSAEVQRKAVHMLVGLYAMALPLFFATDMPVVVLVVLAIVAMIAMRVSAGRLGEAGAAIHSVERRGLGDIWLAVAVGFLFLRSGGSYILYGLPLAIITLSDAAAALTGSTYGRRRFVTEAGVKSWEGIIAFTTVGWIVSMAMLLLFSDAGRGEVILLGLVIAAFGAMVEAVSWRGLDNLFVPLAIHFYLRGFLDAGPLAICLTAILFFAITAMAQGASRWLQLAPHTARAFAVALFIIAGVGGPYGVAMPALAIAAFLLARRYLPVGKGHPELDFLATICGGAAIWLFVGEMIGPTAIHYFNLAFAGMFVAYGVMGLRAAGRGWWSVPLAVLAVALVHLAGRAGWHAAPVPHALPGLAALSLAVVALFCIIAAAWLRRWRAPKAFAIASLMPMSAYLFEVTVR